MKMMSWVFLVGLFAFHIGTTNADAEPRYGLPPGFGQMPPMLAPPSYSGMYPGGVPYYAPPTVRFQTGGYYDGGFFGGRQRMQFEVRGHYGPSSSGSGFRSSNDFQFPFPRY